MTPTPKDSHQRYLKYCIALSNSLSHHLSMVPLWLMDKGSSTITFIFLGVVLGRLFPGLLSSSSLTPFSQTEPKAKDKISMS